MKQTQRLPDEAWIAHDTTTSEAILDTLSSNLTDCMGKYLTTSISSAILDYYGEDCGYHELVDMYEDTIPDNIAFVIVTLIPRWDTQTNKGDK